MDTTGITERVTGILTARIGMSGEAIAADARLVDDLELDSLDSVELAMAMEQEFDIVIREEQLEEVETVRDLVGLVECLLGARNGGA